MAVVLPFAALRYDSRKVGSLEQVLTQPYDKISPEMQREYLRRSPYNFARLIKGETKSGDSSTENVYTRAAAWLRDWREQGVLVQRKAPAYYAYYQKFTMPGSVEGSSLVRKGFVGLGKLEPYDSGVIFRHEQTLSAPKADRLDLLRATRANLESIFLLYSDPERNIEAILDRAAATPPVAEVTDDYGVAHQLWDVDDPVEMQELRQAMADKRLIIADGHHRYETALNFQRECQQGHPGREADCSLALMTFVNMEAEGIVILPTHRLVRSLEGWSSQRFLKAAERYFSITRFPFLGEGDWQSAAEKLRTAMEINPSESDATSIGAVFQEDNAFYCLRQRPEISWEKFMPGLTPAERSLDVTILHRIAFGLCLGMDEEAVRKEKYLSYVRQFDEGVESVMQGTSQACFFLSPVKMHQVRDIAFAGRVLPQKSTDFYPKLLSGLALYPLQH
ncbi:MAG: DUF1015 domain-containing protein [Acidobacteria bacterium]|nr:DUF1015 domain-containing protein [Acidobacteriota bacterium]